MFYSQRIHDKCFRRPHFDAGQFVEAWDSVTEPKYELGPNAKDTRTNIEEIDEAAKYSWIKAPR